MIVYFFPFLKEAFVKINKLYEEGIPNVDTFIYMVVYHVEQNIKNCITLYVLLK